MALKLTLKPDERIIVNGCAMRNSSRRHVLTIETHADVIRGHDLLEPEGIATPVRRVYFLIQTALTRADLRDDLVPAIQKQLAVLATVFGGGNVGQIFEAANFVSIGDYYKALSALRPVMRHEEVILSRKADRVAKGEIQTNPSDAALHVSGEVALAARA